MNALLSFLLFLFIGSFVIQTSQQDIKKKEKQQQDTVKNEQFKRQEVKTYQNQ